MEGNWTNAPAVVFKADKFVYLMIGRAWFNSLKLPISTRDNSVLPPSGQLCCAAKPVRRKARACRPQRKPFAADCYSSLYMKIPPGSVKTAATAT